MSVIMSDTLLSSVGAVQQYRPADTVLPVNVAAEAVVTIIQDRSAADKIKLLMIVLSIYTLHLVEDIRLVGSDKALSVCRLAVIVIGKLNDNGVSIGGCLFGV